MDLKKNKFWQLTFQIFIQVCESLNSEDTIKREFGALEQAIYENPNSEGLLITRDKANAKNNLFSIISGAEAEFKLLL